MIKSFSMEDILLINKPKGITSFDVIRKLRKKLGIKKMGHAGTLDPLASGLMLIGVNKGTKKLSDLIGLPKTYIATMKLGERTPSGDRETEVVETKDVPLLSMEILKEEIKKFTGSFQFPVPKYSAIKKDGKKLYSYARKDQDVEVPIKDMVINSAKLISFKDDEIAVEWNVSSGTYVRTLVEEFAKKLGTIGVMTDLKRTSIGEFRLEDADELDCE